ncbi:hypothetical protein QX776_12495 [Alteromonadaceae bacterium BrNp21-10]|nr:hypothetical protein [Alteromonadaceae bacterium BrNp21-10]
MKMKLNYIAAALVILPVSTSLFAADETITGTFKTIKNVTISQVAGHEMVINGLQPASGATCTVTAITTGGAWPGDTDMKMSSAGALAASGTYGDTSGVTCATGTSVPGIFEIDGAAGATVTVTATNASASGINFVPAGCVGDYDDAPDGDLCTPLVTSGTTVTVDFDLADTGDTTNSAGNGTPEVGVSRLALTGTITSTVGLTAATAYIVPFDVSVTY